MLETISFTYISAKSEWNNSKCKQISLANRGATFLGNIDPTNTRLQMYDISLVIHGFPLFSGSRIVKTAKYQTPIEEII